MLSPGERRFLALAAAAAVCIVSLAFWYAVPPSPAQASSAVVEPLRESFRVDLNTAGIDAMTTLPGLGEKKARAILEYRLAHGRFQSLDEVATGAGRYAGYDRRMAGPRLCELRGETFSGKRSYHE